MPKINILVEGQTEETFVRDVLNPYLIKRYPSTYAHAIVIQTKRVLKGDTWRGGITKYRHFQAQAKRLIGDGGSVALTSMIDLFHLPDDFPNYAEAQTLPLRKRVTALEEALSDDIGSEKFVPYISTHEFEALVLAQPEVLVDVIGADRRKVDKFTKTLANFKSPEHVNGEVAPSKRIQTEFPAYSKVIHGPLSTERIGIDILTEKCKHFANWLRALEKRCGGTS
jgi:hypothetical protein